jgi:hypothetical protein
MLFFAGLFPVTELVPGYINWFMAFPLADLWIAISSLVAGVLLSKNKELSVLFGIASGSSLIFLGLYALLYGVNTKLLFILTTDELIEIAIKIYCLSVGTLFISYLRNGGLITHRVAN